MTEAEEIAELKSKNDECAVLIGELRQRAERAERDLTTSRAQYDGLVKRHTAKVREAQGVQRAALKMGANALKWMGAMMLALGKREIRVPRSCAEKLAGLRLVRERFKFVCPDGKGEMDGWDFKLVGVDEPLGRDRKAT